MWVDNSKMDFRETEIDAANWIQQSQVSIQCRTFVNTLMNLRVP
jgi:hypothetical protein